MYVVWLGLLIILPTGHYDMIGHDDLVIWSVFLHKPLSTFYIHVMRIYPCYHSISFMYLMLSASHSKQVAIITSPFHTHTLNRAIPKYIFHTFTIANPINTLILSLNCDLIALSIQFE